MRLYVDQNGACEMFSAATHLLLELQGREHGLVGGNQEHLEHGRLHGQRAAADARRFCRQGPPPEDGVAQLLGRGRYERLGLVLLVRLPGQEHLRQQHGQQQIGMRRGFSRQMAVQLLFLL